jgi:hypothetical protein
MEIYGKIKGRWFGWTRGCIGISVKPWLECLYGNYWKLLGEPPRKWIRYDQSIISETELWLQRQFPFQVVIGRHPDCNIQALQGSPRNRFFAFLVVVDWWKLNSFLIDVLMYLNCFWDLRVWDLSDLTSVAVFRGVLKVFLGLSWPRLQRCVWGS